MNSGKRGYSLGFRLDSLYKVTVMFTWQENVFQKENALPVTIGSF